MNYPDTHHNIYVLNKEVSMQNWVQISHYFYINDIFPFFFFENKLQFVWILFSPLHILRFSWYSIFQRVKANSCSREVEPLFNSLLSPSSAREVTIIFICISNKSTFCTRIVFGDKSYNCLFPLTIQLMFPFREIPLLLSWCSSLTAGLTCFAFA